jgi:hypothetical protein
MRGSMWGADDERVWHMWIHQWLAAARGVGWPGGDLAREDGTGERGRGLRERERGLQERGIERRRWVVWVGWWWWGCARQVSS